MGFQYKFRKLLEIEKCREDYLMKELNTVQRQLHGEEKMLISLQSELTLRQSVMEKESRTQTDAKVFVLYESYFTKLKRDIVIQSSRVKDISNKTDQVRNNLLSVFKKRRMLEKLHERYKNKYKEQTLRIENKQFDNVATSRFHHKHRKDAH